jgi:hypothetical protein
MLSALLALILAQSPPTAVIAIYDYAPLSLPAGLDGRYVDAAGHVCRVEYIMQAVPSEATSVRVTNVSCFAAAGLAWAKTDPGWQAWLAVHAPNPVPAE